ncbi:twin-arginine translocation signal domain-containing protein [Algoriphagus boritolerans]
MTTRRNLLKTLALAPLAATTAPVFGQTPQKKRKLL